MIEVIFCGYGFRVPLLNHRRCVVEIRKFSILWFVIKRGLLRKKDIFTKKFQELAAEVSMLLAYEATRNLRYVEKTGYGDIVGIFF